MLSDINKAVELMNEYGSKAIPFLFIIDFDMKQFEVLTDDEVEENDILYDMLSKSQSVYTPQKISLEKNPIDFSIYKRSFEIVMDEIHKGNTYLLNLTFPTSIKCECSLKEIYENSKAKFKLLYKDKFVVFSPEPFVVIKDGVISSFPMKGTIDASIENAEEIILADEKELAEHNTIVDLIRNDLSIVAKNVRVEKFRYVEKLETSGKPLLQVSSKITGNLEENYQKNIGAIIAKMLPAGSISGAPKKKTIEIINSAELSPRGFYTGVFGKFDGKNLVSAVMIRFIENTGKGLVYRSGGGITHLSNAKTEYQEMIDKVYVPIN